MSVCHPVQVADLASTLAESNGTVQTLLAQVRLTPLKYIFDQNPTTIFVNVFGIEIGVRSSPL